MEMVKKNVLIAVLLLLSAVTGFAADVKVQVPDVKGAVTSGGESVKAGSEASFAVVEDAAKAKGAVNKSAAKAKLVDINTATEAQLKAVPGFGEAYAAKIIAGRPYANKAQLKSRKILPQNVYEQVKDMIIAKLIKK